MQRCATPSSPSPFAGENDDQAAKDALAAVEELLAPYDTHIATDVGYSKSETLNDEMGIILVVAALVIVAGAAADLPFLRRGAGAVADLCGGGAAEQRVPTSSSAKFPTYPIP